MRIVQAIRTFSPTGWRCPACRYDISNLPHGQLEDGAEAIRCPECSALCITAHQHTEITLPPPSATPIEYRPDAQPRPTCPRCAYTEPAPGPERPFCPNCGVSMLEHEQFIQRQHLRRIDRRYAPRLLWPFALAAALLPLSFVFGRSAVVASAVALALSGTANTIHWFWRSGKDTETFNDLSVLGEHWLTKSQIIQFPPRIQPLFVILTVTYILQLHPLHDRVLRALDKHTGCRSSCTRA